MARQRARCGTYAAYRRHLRDNTSIDDACRRAQRAYDSDRGQLKAHHAAHGRAVPNRSTSSLTLVRPDAPDPLAGRRDEARSRYRKHLLAVVDAEADDDVYRVVELSAEMERLLDDWCDAEDALTIAQQER